MTPIAAKVMADAPLGHTVTIQKSSATPITMKARPALTSEGSQSGTRTRTLRCQGTGRAGSATSSASPFSACEMPASTSAVWSASSRSDGVLAGNAISRRTAASQIRRRPTGSAIQRAGSPCSGADRSSSDMPCRTASVSCRARSADRLLKCTDTARQLAKAANKPSTAVCNTGE